MTVIDRIRERMALLAPSFLEILDDSGLHAGHAGASGGGHFRLTIVSPVFVGKRTMERHRMVYDALGKMMQQDIHALAIAAKTPDEFSS